MVKSEPVNSGFANVRPSFGIKNSVPALQTQDVIAISGMDDCLPFKKSDPVSGLKDSQLAMTLTALRHDHPMIVSIESAAAAQQIHMLRERKLPVGSLSFNSLPPLPSPDHFRTDFDAKRSCLPYGYYYDTEDMIEIEDSILFKSHGIDLEDWIMDDLTASPIGDDCYYRDRGERTHFKQTKDSGPTLAQLNLTDNFDVDELLSSFPDSAIGRSRISFIQPQDQVKQLQHQQQDDVAPRPGIRTATKHHDVQINTLSDHRVTQSKNLHPHPPHQGQVPTEQQQHHQPVRVNEKRETVQLCSPIPPACEPSVPVSTTVSNQESGHVPSKSHHVPIKAAQCSDSTAGNDVMCKSTAMKAEANGEKVPHSSHCKSQPPRARNSSMCTEGSVSSHDEGFASQMDEDSDDDEEVEDSDDESFYGDYEAKDLLGASTSDDLNNRWALNMGRSRKSGQQRFFWQYNVQSKGPKGTRIPAAAASSETADPHVLAEAKDPVFSPECRIEGVKHAGKARRGDGNDLTPNPRKLLMIGLELKKLSRIINDLTPVAEVPVNARNKTRKEKNKLASRACRLKKKAQHEANKIKLFGLQQEHRKTMLILKEIRALVRQNFESRTQSSKSPYTACIDQAVAQQGDFTLVAGRTSDFVNSILDNVSAGQTDGGLKAF